MKKSFKLLIIINIISVMIASILTLQIFATPNYQSFENKTGSIVEEICFKKCYLYYFDGWR